MFHRYVPPPLADMVAELPAHTVVAPLMEVNSEFTNTQTESLAVPQLLVIVTIYLVEPGGLAIGFTQVVQLKPAEGVQEYVPLPLDKREALPPGHIVTSAPAFTDGVVVITTFTESLLLPQLLLAVTVYKVVTDGPATGFAQVLQLSPDAGDQVNIPAPTAFKVVFVPAQMEMSGPALIAGIGFTVIVTGDEFAPQEELIFNVYVVVAVGVATGFAQLVQFNPDDGAQEKVPLPVPDKVVLLPKHIVAGAPAFADGKAGVKTLMESIAVPQLFVTLKVYVVLPVVLQTGFAHVVQLKPVAGDHK